MGRVTASPIGLSGYLIEPQPIAPVSQPNPRPEAVAVGTGKDRSLVRGSVRVGGTGGERGGVIELSGCGKDSLLLQARAFHLFQASGWAIEAVHGLSKAPTGSNLSLRNYYSGNSQRPAQPAHPPKPGWPAGPQAGSGCLSQFARVRGGGPARIAR